MPFFGSADFAFLSEHMLLMEYTTSRFSSFSLTRFRLSVVISQLEKNCQQPAFNRQWSWHRRGGWQINLHKNREKKSPSCFQVPASCSKNCSWSCLSPFWETLFLQFCLWNSIVLWAGSRDGTTGWVWRREDAEGPARDGDLRQAPVQRWQNSNGNCHPSLRRERSRSSSSESWKSGDRKG